MDLGDLASRAVGLWRCGVLVASLVLTLAAVGQQPGDEEDRSPSRVEPTTEPHDNGRKPGRGAPPPPAPGSTKVASPASGPSAAATSDGAPMATATPDSSPAFVDRAAEVGLDFVHFNGMVGGLYIGEVVGSGAALFDYDGDGDLDAFLVQGDRFADPAPHAQAGGQAATKEDAKGGANSSPEDGDEPPAPEPASPPYGDRLFKNLLAETGELRFEDVTQAAGIDGSGYGMGAAVGDVDGDGDPDLYVTALGSNRLWVNDGDGTFTDRTAEARVDDPRWSTAASFFDADGDGDLDLFVGNYVDWTPGHPERCVARGGYPDYCGPLNYPPVADRLLLNRGDGTFVNASSSSGVRFAFGASLGSLACDLMGDPAPEIYVANDASGNQLWQRGDGGAYKDAALETGCAVNGAGQPEGSMGVDAGDYDGDGDLDLVIAHVHRETNTLYANDGSGHFTDVTDGAGLAAPSLGMTGFGAGFLDYDNDGWLDLLVVNGTVVILPELHAAGDPFPLHQPNQLFRNLGPDGGGSGGDRGAVRFADVSASAGDVFQLSEVSRGAAFGDVDDDGDVDVLVTNNHGPARLLINQVGQRRHWLGLTLLGADGRLDPGARVTVHLPDGRRLLRRVRLDGSYLSAHDPRVQVGLGDADGIASLTVRWSDGSEESWGGEALPVDRYHTLRRGHHE